GHAVVEVRVEPLPDLGREYGVRSSPFRVPHRVPRRPARGAGDGELPDELGRLHLRSRDRGAGRGLRLPDRRDRGAHALLPRGVVGELHGVGRVRAEDSGAHRPLPAARAGLRPLAGVREPARALHPASDGAHTRRVIIRRLIINFGGPVPLPPKPPPFTVPLTWYL